MTNLIITFTSIRALLVMDRLCLCMPGLRWTPTGVHYRHKKDLQA